MIPAGSAALILAGFTALIPAGLIAFLALSKKTSPMVKKAAAIALILITLSFAACSIVLVLSGSPVWKKGGAIDLPAVPAGKATDSTALLIMTAVLLFVMIMVIILANREQRKR
jgi:hypothetical protein